jgi:hypothetical protein
MGYGITLLVPHREYVIDKLLNDGRDDAFNKWMDD